MCSYICEWVIASEMEQGEVRWNSMLCSVQDKKMTASYRNVEVCFLIVVFILLVCIMDINNNSEIQLEFQISFSCFYKFGEKFPNLFQAIRYWVMCIKNLHKPFYISPWSSLYDWHLFETYLSIQFPPLSTYSLPIIMTM